MKYMLSNGTWASNVSDFEDVMQYEDFKALENMMNDESRLTAEDKEYWKRAYDEEELHSDALYQRNMNGWNEIDAIINYLQDTPRMNKQKLIKMLQEVQNSLENY